MDLRNPNASAYGQGLLILAGVLATVNLYIRTPDIRPNAVFAFNPFLPFTLMGLGALWWIQGRQPRWMPKL